MERYGKWTVISRYRGTGRHYMVDAICDCGTERTMRSDTIKSGRSKSCGCDMSRLISESNTKHCGRVKNPREYSSWLSMRYRCLSPRCKKYSSYGGRGITICDQWNDFSVFLSDMGDRPEGMTLGRIDNDGPYSPENCRWENPRQQAQNTRKNINLTYNGETKTLSEWARVSGVNAGTVQKRYHAGLPAEKILSKEGTRK